MVLTMRIVNTKESSMSNYVNDYKVSDQIARSCVFENLSVFREEVYELAFGDDAVNKDYSDKEVIKKLFIIATIRGPFWRNVWGRKIGGDVVCL